MPLRGIRLNERVASIKSLLYGCVTAKKDKRCEWKEHSPLKGLNKQRNSTLTDCVEGFTSPDQESLDGEDLVFWNPKNANLLQGRNLEEEVANSRPMVKDLCEQV